MKAPHLWLRDQFYSQPNRAVAGLNLVFGVAVGLGCRSLGWGLAASGFGALLWDRFARQMVISDRRLGPVTLKVPPNHSASGRRVWLTFDDGPGPETPEILDILEHHGACATFFVIGERLAQWPDPAGLAQRLSQGGHRVGHHSWSHPNFMALNREQAWKELEKTDRLLKDTLAEVWLPIFRPPFGYRTATLFELLERLQLHVVGWSLNSLDFLSGPSQEVTQRVLEGVEPEAILLFHDGPHDRGRTVQALPRILTELKAQGYTFAVPSAEDFPS